MIVSFQELWADLGSIRSVLFVPATRPDRIAKAIASDTDAVILDFEDSVTPREKAGSRQALSTLIDECSKARVYAIARINALDTEWGYEDLVASVRAGIDGILVAKVGRPTDVMGAQGVLQAVLAESASEGHQVRPPMLIPTIESAVGLVGLREILSASHAVGGVQLATASGGDLMLDLGATATPAADELTYARGHTVAVARAYGLDVVWDGAYLDIRDTDGLTLEANLAASFGFSGKMAIHPGQVETINQAFSPSSRQVEQALKIVEEYTASVDKGEGVLVVDGSMVDEAIYKRSVRVLARAATHED